jgi:hypothetical protein
MLHGNSYYYRQNQPAKAIRLVLIALLVLLPFIYGKGMVFSSVHTVPVSTTSSNTALANTNSPTLEKQKVTKSEEMPQDLYAAWKQAQAQEAVSDNAYRLEATAAGEVQGRNLAQGLEFSFQSGGVNINGMNLSLTGIGYQGQTLEPLAKVAPIASVGRSSNRVEYQRGTGLTEWYSNKAEGLEQGFTLTQAWPTEQNGSELALEMSLTGGLFHNAGDGLTLVSSEGSATRYGGLYAYDATGRALESRMEVGQNGQTARILVNLTGAQYPIVIDPLMQGQATLTASDGAALNYFGSAVSLGGVGSLVQSQVLTDSYYGRTGDYFGSAVSLSSDGNTALIGAYGGSGNYYSNQGAAYIFVRSGTSWVQQQRLTASDSTAYAWFGSAVLLSGDGNTVVIGATGKTINGNIYQGATYIFVRSGTTWTQQQQLIASDGVANDTFGGVLSLSSDGNTALIGTFDKAIGANTGQGAAYLFVRNGTNWVQQQILTANDGCIGLLCSIGSES